MREIDKYVDEIYINMNKKSKDMQDLKNEMKIHLTSSVKELKASGYSQEESIKIAIERFGEINEIEDELNEITKISNIRINRIKKIATIVIVIIYALIVIRIKFMNSFGRESLLMTKKLIMKNPELLKNILNIVPFRGINSEVAATSLIANLIIFIPLGFFIAKMKSYKKKIMLILTILIGIELIQYVFSLGIANINDVIVGFLGSVIGMLVNSNNLLSIRIKMTKNIIKKVNKITSVRNK